jgi:ATP-binding cassette, subfamily B, bacterial
MGWMRGAAVDEEDRLSGAEARRVLRRSLAMMRPYRRQLAGAVVVMLASTATILAGPALVRYGIDHGLRSGDAGAVNLAAAGYLVAAVAALALARLQILLVARLGEQFLRDLRVRVFAHIQSMSMGFFDKQQTGRLVARMTSDIDSLQELVQQGLVMFVVNFLLLFFSAIVLFSMSPLLSVLCLAAVPLLVAASVRFQRLSNEAFLTVRDRISQTLSTLQEGLSGVRVIQAFAREEHQEERFSSHNRAQLSAHLRAIRISALYFPVVEMSGTIATATVVGLGGVLVHRDAVTLGTVAAFVLYLNNVFEPINQLSQLFNLVQSAGAALSKLFGLLDTRSPLEERPGAVDLPTSGAIEVDRVGFRYSPDGPAVLDGVSLTVAAGERVALVGPTGAGKSTLAKLMARMYDPADGAIRFGGVDLRDARLASVRQRMVVVPQEGHLFQGSVRDNVRVGRFGASDAEVESALDRLGLLQRFQALPEGLDTEVREAGSRLSAGERQLVSLARAALADPEVLVLDEATSSLDPGTEVYVERAMETLMRGRTVIVIAHRLSTAERADRVAVVDGGGVAELGTHAELVGAGGRYAALFASWSAGSA